MSLQVWLPMTKDLKNQGIADVEIINNGATLDSAGKLGGCYYFDGVNNRISCSSYTWSYPISIGAWFKPTDVTNTATQYWLSYNTNTGGSAGQAIAIGTYRGVFSVWYAGVQRSFSDVNLSNGVWYNIYFSMTSNSMTLYLNGEMVYTGAFSRTKPNSVWFTIGARSNSSSGGAGDASYYYKGYMNDVRLYDHALSPMEVKHLSQGLVLHYPLDNNGCGQKNLITQTMIDAEPWKSAIQGTYEVDNKKGWILAHNVLYSKSGNGANNIFSGLTYEENTQYTISFKWRDDYRTDGKNSSMYIIFKYSDGTQSKVTSKKYDYWKEEILTSTAGKTVISIVTSYGNGGQLLFTDLKLEKGTRKTPFSPIINSDLYVSMGLNDEIEYDISGYGNNGTKVGTLSYSTDSPRYLASTVFDGTNNIGFPIALGGQKDCTIAFWAKPNTDARGCMLSLERNTYWQFTFGSHLLYIRDSSTGYTGTRKTYSIGTLVANTWTHICATYSSGILKIYRDGEMLSTNTVGGTNLCNELNEGRIGSAMQSGYFWSGNISDVRIYATALSDSDIQKLYAVSASIDSNGNAYSAAYVED